MPDLLQGFVAKIDKKGVASTNRRICNKLPIHNLTRGRGLKDMTCAGVSNGPCGLVDFGGVMFGGVMRLYSFRW
jgi:hypothetical protein